MNATQTRSLSERATNARTSIGKRFGSYGPEEERAVRKPDVKEDLKIKRLIGIWQEFNRIVGRNFEDESVHRDCISENLFVVYSQAIALVHNVRCTPREVAQFSLTVMDEIESIHDTVEEFQKCGPFMSALINCGRHRIYRLPLHHFGGQLGGLGCANTKKLILSGDMRGNLGNYMKSGSILLDGNVIDDIVGHEMEGGIITVNGNVDGLVGRFMKGGKIIVNGNVDFGIGHKMQGGEIHLNGDFEGIGTVEGGRIYHKGELIVDK